MSNPGTGTPNSFNFFEMSTLLNNPRKWAASILWQARKFFSFSCFIHNTCFRSTLVQCTHRVHYTWAQTWCRRPNHGDRAPNSSTIRRPGEHRPHCRASPPCEWNYTRVDRCGATETQCGPRRSYGLETGASSRSLHSEAIE